MLYIHCVFSSLSGTAVAITSYTSSNYFSKSRAFVSALLAGAAISSTMWFSIYQVKEIIYPGRSIRLSDPILGSYRIRQSDRIPGDGIISESVGTDPIVRSDASKRVFSSIAKTTARKIWNI